MCPGRMLLPENYDTCSRKQSLRLSQREVDNKGQPWSLHDVFMVHACLVCFCAAKKMISWNLVVIFLWRTNDAPFEVPSKSFSEQDITLSWIYVFLNNNLMYIILRRLSLKCRVILTLDSPKLGCSGLWVSIFMVCYTTSNTSVGGNGNEPKWYSFWHIIEYCL